VVSAVELKYASVDRRWRRHLGGTTVFAVQLRRWVLVLVLRLLLLNLRLFTTHQTHQEIGVGVTSRVRHGILVIVLGLRGRRVRRTHGVDSGRYARLRSA
jgi:hypothetical protein